LSQPQTGRPYPEFSSIGVLLKHGLCPTRERRPGDFHHTGTCHATKDINKAVFAAGWYISELWQKKYPKIQILTIEQLLDGTEVQMPPSHSGYKKAERIKPKMAYKANLDCNKN
jgi:hypothetical protein